jgi:uncharacterized protein YqeY
MAELKARIKTDLTAAMRAKDVLVVSTLRLALSAVQTEEVAGTTARELSDDEVLKVLAKEAKKRVEAAEAFAGAGREELAAKERAEGEVLDAYLPAQLSDDEVTALAAAALAQVTAETGQTPGMRQMGQVMKLAAAAAAGRADGSRVSAAVKAQLQG